MSFFAENVLKGEEDDVHDDYVDQEEVEMMLARQRHHEAMVDFSLTRDQPAQKLGQWEQFTKVRLFR